MEVLVLLRGPRLVVPREANVPATVALYERRSPRADIPCKETGSARPDARPVQLETAADASGDDARALAEQLAAPLDAAIRLSLLDALSAAAQEITCELAPSSVDVRLRGRDPEFVVTIPAEPVRDVGLDTTGDPWSAEGVAAAAVAGDEGGTARINLRMPEQLKARVDHAATAEGFSVNAWLVRAAAAALERADPARRLERRGPKGSARFTGWARQ